MPQVNLNLDEPTLAALHQLATKNGVNLDQAAGHALENYFNPLALIRIMAIPRIAHNILTPLNPVVSFSEAILEGMDGDISDLVRTDVETIKEHGRQALQTLTMLLDIAKLEMGQFEPTFERLDPLPLFRKAVDYATSLRPQVQLQGVIEDRLPAIVGDAQHLPQLFEPPLVNAVLSAKNVLMEIRQNGGDLVVRIEDDRNPLPSSIESLFRNHLRLLLSYHLARLHKGELTFDTKNGFVFLLRIPGA